MDNLLGNIGDFIGAFSQGTSMNALQQKRAEQERLNQMRGLQEQAVQGGVGSDAFKSLAGMSPDAATKLKSILATDDQGLNAAFQDASVFKNLLQNDPTGQSAINFGMQRLQAGQSQGRNMIHTQRFLEEVQSDPAAALGSIDSFLSIPDEISSKSSKQAYAPSNTEKDLNKINSLRVQLASAENSGDADAIEAAQQQLSDFQRLSGKFGQSQQEKSDIRVAEAANKVLSTQAAQASKEAFDGLKNVRSSIGNMTDAISALNRGAETGKIVSSLPSFRESSIELDNIRGKMGLDIIGATTFGALSKDELNFALNVGLPTSLEPKDLKKWLVKKRNAQKKLGKELMRAATYLGKPGNTIASFIEKEQAAGRLKFDEATETGNTNLADLSDEELFN